MSEESGVCGTKYGVHAISCRRMRGHVGECGQVRNNVEAAIIRALEATEHLRKLEREGERISEEAWRQVLRRDDRGAPATCECIGPDSHLPGCHNR